jgi:beta-glucosidase
MLPLPFEGETSADPARIENLLSEMTLAEKVEMMSGHGFFQQLEDSGQRWGGHPYRAGGGCERLGVPAFYFTDGPRGVARGQSTCFPVTMARGATFDVDLERRVGEIMGVEARAQGCNLSGAVCINLLRHPAWGRAQETYGEDPYHLGEMGAALAQGIQTHNVAATVKHFALNSIENARFKVDVRIDERTLREVYLPHFKRVIDAGCATVMSAYNKMNGEYCGQNRVLLTDILRGEWGFDGFVHSDWIRGVYKPYGASAGLDVENPEPSVFGAKLVAAVEAGDIEPSVIDTACRRILNVYYRFADAEDPLEHYPLERVACPEHRAVAREAAQKAAVLLTNDGTLPLDPAALRKVAVIGRLAEQRNTGDRGSSMVQPAEVVTPLMGLAAALGPGVQLLRADEDDLDAVRQIAAEADAVICIVGLTYREEGEFLSGTIVFRTDDDLQAPTPQGQSGGDRDSLRLPQTQEAMIQAAAEANPRTVVAMASGSAVIVESWRASPAAILQTFYCGMEGGHALADLLLGKVSPSGKLPFTVPSDAAELPDFDKNAVEITYGPLHGYTLFDSRGLKPAFPFGFGLSYARFGYRALVAQLRGDRIEATVTVRNLGDMAAEEVVQLYVGFPGQTAVRPPKLLRGFRRVRLAPGESRAVRFDVPLEQLRWWNPDIRDWVIEHGVHDILVGGSSDATDLLKAQVTV